ncbi:MAG: hypothetical protein ACTHON_10720 [Humibacter sp.]
MDGDLWEIKSPQGSSKNTIAHQWSRAKKQGTTRLVLDMARTTLTDGDVLAEIRRRLAADDDMTQVIHIARDGTATRLTRE